VDDEELTAAIAAASRALVGVAARSIADSGADITLPQYRALVVLSTRGPQRMSVLAGHLGLAPSSVTRLVERLERKGLAGRQPSVESRREVSVTATAGGATLIEQVMERRRTFISESLVRIPRRRRLAMLTAFREFAEAVGEPIEIDPWGDPNL